MAGVPPPEVAVIVAGGEPVDRAVIDRLPAVSFVIAADSGLDHAERLGLRPDLVVGDLDSVSDAALDRARARGVTIDRHPAAKDATDLELALERAEARGFRRVVMLGGQGGRLSHLLGNALVLAAEPHAAIAVEWHIGHATLQVARPGRPVDTYGAPGDLVSLLAAGGPAEGVTTVGLRWQLDGATLQPGSTRGISNEMTTTPARVSVAGGALITIHERIRS